jgi:hypothetical protein
MNANVGKREGVMNWQDGLHDDRSGKHSQVQVALRDWRVPRRNPDRVAAGVARLEMGDGCVPIVLEDVAVIVIHRMGPGVLMIVEVRGRPVLMFGMIVSAVRMHVQRRHRSRRGGDGECKHE